MGRMMLERFLIAVSVAIALCSGSPQTGTFTTRDGSQCTWFDLQISHDELSLATACVCKDEEGHSQSYGCQYTGELYSCDEYKTHSEEVLLGLIQQLSGQSVVLTNPNTLPAIQL